MADTSLGKTTPPEKRLSGGFWRRAFAAFIDLAIVLSVYQAAGLYFYQGSHGHLRMSSSFISSNACHTDTHLIGRNETQPRLRPDSTTTCRYYFFGYEYNRTKKITEVVKSSTDKNGFTNTQTRFETYYVDDKDHRIEVYDIDGLKGLVCLIVFTLMEGLAGATIGKAVLGLRLENKSGQRPALLAVLWRNLLIWGGWTVLGAANIIEPYLESHHLTLYPYPAVGIVLLAVCIIAMVMPYVSLIFSRPNPYYDDWSGIKVKAKSPGKNQPQSPIQSAEAIQSTEVKKSSEE